MRMRHEWVWVEWLWTDLALSPPRKRWFFPWFRATKSYKWKPCFPHQKQTPWRHEAPWGCCTHHGVFRPFKSFCNILLCYKNVISLMKNTKSWGGVNEVSSSDGSGTKIFDPGRVGSAIYGLGLNLENFNFFPFGSKKISLGRVRKYPGRRRVSLLFTAGQK